MKYLCILCQFLESCIVKHSVDNGSKKGLRERERKGKGIERERDFRIKKKIEYFEMI